MTSGFSSNDAAVIERNVETSPDDQTIIVIWNKARCLECSEWITENNLKRICLQFPDNLIKYSIKITKELSDLVGREVFVLGDTSYGSCCIDEIAAAHINADGIIHFGHACLSKVSRLPVFYVFPNFSMDPGPLFDEINQIDPDGSSEILVFYDVGYFYSLDSIREKFRCRPQIKFAELAVNTEADLLSYYLGSLQLEKISTCVYIGQDDQAFFNLNISLHDKSWYLYNPSSVEAIKLKRIDPLGTKWMKRRYFYIEKCKDAQSIGIVVATLTAKGYLDVVTHIQKLAKIRGIRTYLISVGKVNPAKLANFLDIDCFVLIGCPENNLLTSREFYKPLLSTFEIEVALNPVWHEQMPDHYFVEFKEVLPNGKYYREFNQLLIDESDVSLVTGKLRFANKTTENVAEDGLENALLKRENLQLTQMDSQASFQNRSWTGLDPALGKMNPVKVIKGRSGIPMKYDDADIDEKK